MEILEAYDLTRCYWSAAELAGCDAKTVERYVAVRDRGGDPAAPGRRERITDPHLGKTEERVERSGGRIRADVVHRRLQAMGFKGSERTTRRMVAEVKAAWRAGRRRVYRPWVTEPGMWLQWDWGQGLTEAAACGAQRDRSTMARAVELSKVLGTEAIDQALGIAAAADRFSDADLVSIVDHLAVGVLAETRADEEHSAQPGTGAWEGFGR